MVIVFPETRAVLTGAEKTCVRTPVVPEPLVMEASVVYVLRPLSAMLTVPLAGSIANVTMIVLPAGTPPAGTVTLRLVPEVVLVFCPILIGVPMPNALLTPRLRKAVKQKSSVVVNLEARNWTRMPGNEARFEVAVLLTPSGLFQSVWLEAEPESIFPRIPPLSNLSAISRKVEKQVSSQCPKQRHNSRIPP
jgi:hypothetical protein